MWWWVLILLFMAKCSHGLTFTCWGCCGLCFWHKPIELAHSFLSCSRVYFCLCGPFNCISFHEFSWQLSAFSLCSSALIYALMVLSTVYLYESLLQFNIILCGWLGLKHKQTNYCFLRHCSFSLLFLYSTLALYILMQSLKLSLRPTNPKSYHRNTNMTLWADTHKQSSSLPVYVSG